MKGLRIAYIQTRDKEKLLLDKNELDGFCILNGFNPRLVFIGSGAPFKLRNGLLAEIGKFVAKGYSAQHTAHIISDGFKKTDRHTVRRFTLALIEESGKNFKCPCGLDSSHKSTCEYREGFDYYSKHTNWMNFVRFKPRNCVFCGKSFTPKRKRGAVLCSASCRTKNNFKLGKMKSRDFLSHCIRGHELKDPNLYYSKGRRFCKKCAIYRATKRCREEPKVDERT